MRNSLFELSLCNSIFRQVDKLARVDAVVLNASVVTKVLRCVKDNESTITVNVVSTTLLTLLLLSTIKSFAAKWEISPAITVVSSEIQTYTSFLERETPNAPDTFNNKETTVMLDR